MKEALENVIRNLEEMKKRRDFENGGGGELYQLAIGFVKEISESPAMISVEDAKAQFKGSETVVMRLLEMAGLRPGLTCVGGVDTFWVEVPNMVKYHYSV